MTSKTRPNFTDEFKAEMVALLQNSGQPLSQLAQVLGIEQSVLRAWRRKLRPLRMQSPRPSGSAGNGHAATAPAVTADQAEIRRLRRELKRVQIERDVVEKAISIFSGSPR